MSRANVLCFYYSTRAEAELCLKSGVPERVDRISRSGSTASGAGQARRGIVVSLLVRFGHRGAGRVASWRWRGCVEG